VDPVAAIFVLSPLWERIKARGNVEALNKLYILKNPGE
jgi:hypothetical protein